MAELIVILFGVWTCRSPVNCVFDGNQDPPRGKGHFLGTYLGMPRVLVVDILRVICKGVEGIWLMATSTIATCFVIVVNDNACKLHLEQDDWNSV